MKQTITVLLVILVLSGIFSYLYLSGRTTHTLEIAYDATGETLTFPEPSGQVYKARIKIAGTFTCRTSIEITKDGNPYHLVGSLGAGEIEGEAFYGDWYPGAELGMRLQPEERPCNGNSLRVRVTYFE